VQAGDLEQQAAAAVQLPAGPADGALDLERSDADDGTQQVLLDTEVSHDAQVTHATRAVGAHHEARVSFIYRRHAELVRLAALVGGQVGLGGGGVGGFQPEGQAKGSDTGSQHQPESSWKGGKARRVDARWYHGWFFHLMW